MRATSHDRLASETLVEKKATGLLQVRDRLASETTEEREARLQQMRDRLASKISEESGYSRCMIDRLIIHEYGGDGDQATVDGCSLVGLIFTDSAYFLNNPRLMQSMVCCHPEMSLARSYGMHTVDKSVTKYHHTTLFITVTLNVSHATCM